MKVGDNTLCQVCMQHLDYCKSLFINIQKFLIIKLQHVQNAAARIVLNLKKYDFVTPYLTASVTPCKTAHYQQTEPHCVQGIKG